MMDLKEHRDDPPDDRPSVFYGGTSDEYCPNCEAETGHHVAVEVWPDGAPSGVQPHQMFECAACGHHYVERR